MSDDVSPGPDAESPPSAAQVTRRVEWVDTDASGHHHNSLIMRLVEAAEASLVSAAGIAEYYAAAAPRVRHEIDFTGPLDFGQDATATVVVERLGRASITLSFDVWGEPFAGRPRRPAASGRVVAAHVPPGATRAEPWPDAVRAALRARDE